MKRFFIICILAYLLPLCAFGQLPKKGELRWGTGLLWSKADPSNSYSDISYSGTNAHTGFSLFIQGGLWENIVGDLMISFGKNQFIRKVPNGATDETGDRFLIPFLIKIGFLKYVSLGLGGYASYKMGSVESTSSQIPQSEKTSAHDAGEHGLQAALGAVIPFGSEKTSLHIEYRHSYSLTARPFEAKNYQHLFLGFSWMVGK